MARYVLIEIDDNETAGDLVYAIQNNPDAVFFYKKSANAEAEYTIQALIGARVRALFAKPTNFCECPPSDNSVKGRKLGWYVCGTCGKCKRGVCQHPRNLLDDIDMPVRLRQLYLGIWEPKDSKEPTYGAPKIDSDYRGKRAFK